MMRITRPTPTVKRAVQKRKKVAPQRSSTPASTPSKPPTAPSLPLARLTSRIKKSGTSTRPPTATSGPTVRRAARLAARKASATLVPPKAASAVDRTTRRSAKRSSDVAASLAISPPARKHARQQSKQKAAPSAPPAEQIAPKRAPSARSPLKEHKTSVTTTRNKKPTTPLKHLSMVDALHKYRARLYTIPAREFAVLHNAYLSVYEPSLRRKTPAPGVFPFRWAQVLVEVARDHGAHVKGMLPHYGHTLNAKSASVAEPNVRSTRTGLAVKRQLANPLKIFDVCPNVVPRGLLQRYQQEASMPEVVGERVYVGPAMCGESESMFAFLPSDAYHDTFWEALRELTDSPLV